MTLTIHKPKLPILCRRLPKIQLRLRGVRQICVSRTQRPASSSIAESVDGRVVAGAGVGVLADTDIIAWHPDVAAAGDVVLPGAFGEGRPGGEGEGLRGLCEPDDGQEEG